MISGIILASGFSRRMNREKLTLTVGGIPMLERVIRAAATSGLDEVLLVYRNDEIGALGRKYGLTLVHNPAAQEGQSAAVKEGVKCVHPASAGLMFLVGDQPYLSSHTVSTLAAVFNKDVSRIVVPTYKGKRGNPVIFPSSLKQVLLSLQGDQGGRAVIDTMPHLISRVAIPDEPEATDIDTTEDYEKLR